MERKENKAVELIKNKWKDVLLVVLSVILVYMMAGVLNQKEVDKVADKGPKVVYVGHDTEEPLENFSKEGAIDALVDILKEVGKNKDGNDFTIEERINKLSNEEATIDDLFTDKALSGLYYSDEFGSDEFNRSFTGSSLLTFYELLVDESGEDFGPIYEIVDGGVYLDNKYMVASIPLDLLLGAPTGVSFQMQYDDGAWQLNPYSATMSLHLMGMIEASRAPQE